MKLINLKSILLIAVLSVIISKTNAQEGPYFTLELGYGVNMNAQNYPNMYDVSFLQESNKFSSIDTVFTNYVYDVTSTQKKMSFGSGINFGGTFGYMINDYIGIELGIQYNIGNKFETNQDSTYTYTTVTEANDETTTGVENDYNTDVYKMNSNQFRIIPSIVIMPKSKGIKPYAKFGVAIGIGKINTSSEVVSDYILFDDFGNLIGEFRSITLRENELSGGLALGFKGAAGVIIPINKQVSFFGELSAMTMSYAPKKGEIIKHSVNGEDNLGDLKEYAAYYQTEYVNEIQTDYTDLDLDSPYKELKQYYSYGYLSFSVGIRVSL